MFSRSAMAFGVVATFELLVLLLAVGHFGVLLLLAVVAALSAFGTVFAFQQTAGLVALDLAPKLALSAAPSTASRRDLADPYSALRAPYRPGINPPAAPKLR